MYGRVMCRPHFCSTQRYSVKQVMDLWVTGTIRFQCLVLTDQFIPPQATGVLDNSVNYLEMARAGTMQSVYWMGCVLHGPGFESRDGGNDFYPFQNIQTSSGAHKKSYTMGTEVPYRGQIGWRVVVTSNPSLAPRLIISADTPLFWLHVFKTLQSGLRDLQGCW